MSERLQSFDAQAVAGCLQRFLLDLPSPIFPEILFPRLLQIFAAFSGNDQKTPGVVGSSAKMTATTIKALRTLFSFGESSKDDGRPPSGAHATAAAFSASSAANTSSASSSSAADEWHPMHRGTFHFLMGHLCRVWSIQASLLLPYVQRDDGPPTQLMPTQLMPTQLASAFSLSLVVPPWHDVSQLVQIKSTLTLIVETLLFEFDWGENVKDLVAVIRSAKPPAPPSRSAPAAAAEAIPILGYQQMKNSSTSSSPSELFSLSSTPPSSLQQQPTQQRPNNNNNNNNPSPVPHQGTPVAGCSSYWGSISRDDANNLLKG